MPPNRFSRHKLTQGYAQSDGTTMLSDPEPFRFVAFADNVRHVVVQGDTLWQLAGLHFKSPRIPRPSRYWWAIADFQPTTSTGEVGPNVNHPPIFDPTIDLVAGRTVHIPSLRTLFEEILSERRRPEYL